MPEQQLGAGDGLIRFASTATAAGTTTLTSLSAAIQVFTGVTTQTVKLPSAAVLQGEPRWIINLSTGAVTVQSSAANTIVVLAANTAAWLTAQVTTPTTAANWDARYLALIATSGKSLSVSNTLTLAGTDGTTFTFPGTSDTVATLAATQTLTTTRVNPRVTAVSNTTSWTINSDTTDYAENTGLTGAVTINNPTGTPTNGQELRISVTGTASRAISYGTAFEDSTLTRPATTSSTSRLDMRFVWNTATSKWRFAGSF